MRVLRLLKFWRIKLVRQRTRSYNKGTMQSPIPKVTWANLGVAPTPQFTHAFFSASTPRPHPFTYNANPLGQKAIVICCANGIKLVHAHTPSLCLTHPNYTVPVMMWVSIWSWSFLMAHLLAVSLMGWFGVDYVATGPIEMWANSYLRWCVSLATSIPISGATENNINSKESELGKWFDLWRACCLGLRQCSIHLAKS